MLLMQTILETDNMDKKTFQLGRQF